MGRGEGAVTLARLSRVARLYAPGLAHRKHGLLLMLSRLPLESARQVFRLHELLCFLDAYPDDERVRSQVRVMLRKFRDRVDLARNRAALAGSGIAGTDIPFRFFWPTAWWIARNWPGALFLDRRDEEATREILAALPLLLDPARAEWLALRHPADLECIDRLLPAGMTDADFLNSLIAAMPGNEFTREAFGDRLDKSYVLRSRRDTPERSTTRFNGDKVHYQTAALQHGYPDLRVEARHGPQRVRALRGRDAQSAIRVARVSMVTRERDVAGFQFADPEDVFLVEDGRGLAFAMMGMTPARRATLPATYTAMTLQNGVPIGYVQAELLGRHGALSFNMFETFRGGEAARVLARFIAVSRRLFGCTSFSVEPYQLGVGNEEGIRSGAWWFYHRLGFRPRNRLARKLAAREIARVARNSGYRSSARTLRLLAKWHVFLSLDPTRRARLPQTAGLLDDAARELRRFPQRKATDRDRAATAAAARWLGAGRPGPRRRRMLGRWAGLVLALARRGRWSPPERRQLLRLVEAKSGISERDYLGRLRRLARLRRLLDC